MIYSHLKFNYEKNNFFFLSFFIGLTTSAQQCGVYSNGDNIFTEINGDSNAQFDIKIYWNWVRQGNGSSVNSEI